MAIPTGKIVQISPATLGPGLPIQLQVDYNAYYPTPTAVAGWRTRLIGQLDGFRALNVDFHVGGVGNRIDEVVNFNGKMPNHAISGFLQLEKLPELIYGFLPFPVGSVEILDNLSFTIHTPREEIPYTPFPPEPSITIPTLPSLPSLPEIPGLPSPEGTTLGIKNKYLMYAGIVCAIAVLLYFLVFRKKKKGKLPAATLPVSTKELAAAKVALKRVEAKLEAVKVKHPGLVGPGLVGPGKVTPEWLAEHFPR